MVIAFGGWAVFGPRAVILNCRPMAVQGQDSGFRRRGRSQAAPLPNRGTSL